MKNLKLFKLTMITAVFLLAGTIILSFFPYGIEARMGDEDNPYGFWVNGMSLNMLKAAPFPKQGNGPGNGPGKVMGKSSSEGEAGARPEGSAPNAASDAASLKGESNGEAIPREAAEGQIIPASMTHKAPSQGEGSDKLKDEARGKPGDGKDTKEKKDNNSGGVTMGHSFMRNRSPVESLYLFVKGAEIPEEAPEVYYRFTARTLERHGGVPLGSAFYRAKVEKDQNGLWRADLVGKSFGTFEVYSKYKVKGSVFYSQFNILHFVTEDIKDGPDMESVSGLPSDWPEYVFPFSRQNKMPFRGMETDTKVDFEALRGGKPILAVNSYLLDAKDGPYMPAAISLVDASKGKYSLSPPNDPSLYVSRSTAGGRPGGRVGFKNMVALLELPNNEFMTFTLTVSRSRWTYRKIGLGLVFVLTISVIVGLVTAQRRGKFKYNEFN